MLKFLGRGSAFNYIDENNSAFYIENNKLILIDCGETTFSRILELDLLDNIERVDVFITHTHPDHIGSLGSLIYYFYFIKKRFLNLVMDKYIKHKDSILKILSLMGVKDNMFNVIDIKTIPNEYKIIHKAEYVYTRHYKGLDSYGIRFSTSSGNIYYSGDTNDLKNIKESLLDDKIIKIYVDITLDDFEGNPHLSLKKLEENIKASDRDKIYCMHINNGECEAIAIKLGFNVVKLYKK